MSIEHLDNGQMPEEEHEPSIIEPSDLLAIDSLSEVSLERKKQAALEKYGDDLDFERSQQLERALQRAWPFVSMFDVESWEDRAERTPEARELLSGKYISQDPPEDSAANHQLLYGVYRQAWEKVRADGEDLDGWTALRWCLENNIKNRCTYYPGSESSGRMVFREDMFSNYGWDYESPGSPSYWSTRGNVDFEFPSFEEARAASLEERSSELEEYKERIDRRASNMTKIDQLVGGFSTSTFMLPPEDDGLRQEIRDFGQSAGMLAYEARRWMTQKWLAKPVSNEVRESMRGDFSSEVERGEALFEKVKGALGAKRAKEMEEERLRQVEHEAWLVVKEEELRPILNVTRSRTVTFDENGQRHEELAALTDVDIRIAGAIKSYAEEAAEEAGGSELAYVILDSVRNAPFGRARQLAYMGESLPALAQKHDFRRARDLDEYLMGAIAWLEQLSPEAEGAISESEQVPEIPDDMELDDMLALLQRQTNKKRL